MKILRLLLSWFCCCFYIQKGSKTILNDVSGEFRAGELTAILGPSGCGKTTLLNVLAGYRIHKTSGRICVNNKTRNMELFSKMSRYVLQEDHINPYFTVWETMMFASNFKSRRRYANGERQTEINDILETFQLREHAGTMTSQISGGQRKRVCIALELLDKPAVLFLDEPTTGLDEFSAKQCVTQLKRLAQSRRTIICSIHSPSARLLPMFDKVYALAEGQCIYQGPLNHIVEYLERFSLLCPLNYNPADFIIEVSSHAYGNFHTDMVQTIKNGKILKWQPDTDVSQLPSRRKVRVKEIGDQRSRTSECDTSSWWIEFKWLVLRNLKEMLRDKTNLRLRVLVHILMAAIVGYVYFGIGTNGKMGFFNFHFSLLCSVLCVFMAMTPMIAYVPQDMLYLRREHFNQWYRLSSYFAALLAAQLPIMISMSFVSSAILYILADQPLQGFRFLLFFGITLLTAMMGCSYGILIGSRFSVVNALFLGPSIMSVFVILSCHAVETTHLPLFDSIVMYSSCITHSLEGFLAALLQQNRSDITCPSKEIFCIMSKPGYVLKLAGNSDVNYTRSVECLLAFYIVFASLAFVNLHSRLSTSGFFVGNRLYRYALYMIRKYLYEKMF